VKTRQVVKIRPYRKRSVGEDEVWALLGVGLILIACMLLLIL
jgi:hypothetical protein